MSAEPRRLGLVGGESTGKTRLSGALAAALPGCVAPEELRAFADRMGRVPTAAEQWDVMRAQARAEDRAAASCDRPWVIGDPAPLMTAVYSLIYYDDPALLDEAVTLARGYELVAWCDQDIPWVAEAGMRDGPDHRRRAHEAIGAVLQPLLAAAGVPVLLVSGSLEERRESVLGALAAG